MNDLDLFIEFFTKMGVTYKVFNPSERTRRNSRRYSAVTWLTVGQTHFQFDEADEFGTFSPRKE